MQTIQSGEIEASQINGHYWAGKKIKAERKQGSSRVLFTVPVGPRTESVVTFFLDEEELMRLAKWMRGELR